MIPYSKICNITTGYAVATDADTSDGVKKSWLKRERANGFSAVRLVISALHIKVCLQENRTGL